MKKYSLGTLSLLLLTLALPAISWISIKRSNIQVSTSYTSNNVQLVSLKNSTFSAEELFDHYVSGIYNNANLSTSDLDFNVFKKAVIGYHNFKEDQLVANHPVITIVDFNKSSKQKRLWIIDLEKNLLLFNTLVAHGQGSGDDMAQHFSNIENSHRSSLGFYITSDIYFGKHGLSMKLNGMDEGFNSNAKERAIVVHGAEYVSQDFINQHGRLGRSHGCPALPPELTAAIIDTIKGHTCLYINGSENSYSSNYLDQSVAVNDFSANLNSVQTSL